MSYTVVLPSMFSVTDSVMLLTLFLLTYGVYAQTRITPSSFIARTLEKLKSGNDTSASNTWCTIPTAER